jgi:putative copper export protein
MFEGEKQTSWGMFLLMELVVLLCYVTVGTFTRRGLSSTAALALKSRVGSEFETKSTKCDLDSFW